MQNKPKLYQEYYLKPSTERFVRKIWILDNSKNSEPLLNQSILPNGCMNIAIIKGKGANAIINDKQFTLNNGVFICSQMTNKVIANFEAETKVIFIQLEAWIVSYYGTYDCTSFVDTIEELDDNLSLFGMKSGDLFTKNISNLVDSIDTYFAVNAKHFEQQTDVEKIARKILKNKGQIDIKTIYKELIISKRTFQIHFKKATGLSLSKFIKIIKLRATIDDMRTQQESKKLTAVALDNDYYDQAHFIKSFKEITKLTPKKFIPKNYLLADIR